MTNDYYNLTLNYSVGDWVLTSITGYMDREEELRLEYDASHNEVLYVLAENEYDQFSQEILWFEPWGVSWNVGVDGISLFLVVLTGCLTLVSGALWGFLGTTEQVAVKSNDGSELTVLTDFNQTLLADLDLPDGAPEVAPLNLRAVREEAERRAKVGGIRFDGQVAVVTGAGSGIGRALGPSLSASQSLQDLPKKSCAV